MRQQTLDSLSRIKPKTWDSLFGSDYPFVKHRFLQALEIHGCVGEAMGWIPQHAVLQDEDGVIQACAPQYLKLHSWGEFVFDFSWAEASQQLGAAYYPKQCLAIPYTPASGPRVGGDSRHRAALIEQLLKADFHSGSSSVHALFLDSETASEFQQQGALLRHDLQFQWRNQAYADFQAFIAQLTHKRRKELRRERRKLADAGIRFQWFAGDQLNESQWQQVYALYASTYLRRGQQPYLSREFWLDYGASPQTPVRVVLAYDGAQIVACALCVEGGDTLYGRHWGAADFYDGLHFETCYYQGIEWCINHGLQRFDAGTQGQHKLSRGFEPVITRSAHLLHDKRLHQAVAHFLQREQRAVADQAALLANHGAYREGANEPAHG